MNRHAVLVGNGLEFASVLVVLFVVVAAARAEGTESRPCVNNDKPRLPVSVQPFRQSVKPALVLSRAGAGKVQRRRPFSYSLSRSQLGEAVLESALRVL